MSLRILGAVCIALVVGGSAASGSESAKNFYLLGSKGQGAGIVPPEGVYSANPFYYYSGEAAGSTSIPFGGVIGTATVGVNIEAEAALYLPTALWVTPVDILGGDLALGLTGVFGKQTVDVGATISSSGGMLSGTASDTWSSMGDPVPFATLGWHEGDSHWSVTTQVNVPVGNYDPGEISNVAFNHWAVDFTGAYTWLDAATGWELSTAAGVTFNAKNATTQYKSGDEFHLEFAAANHLSETLTIGVTGYHYQQISGDSGAGAALGAFKGRTTAIGPEINAIIPIDGVPLITNFKWLEEFGVKNRIEGRSAFLTLTVPLGGAPQ